MGDLDARECDTNVISILFVNCIDLTIWRDLIGYWPSKMAARTSSTFRLGRGGRVTPNPQMPGDRRR